MNKEMKLSRQRRRKLTSKVLSEEELQDLIKEAVQFGIEYTTESVCVNMAVVLRDELKLSKPKTRLAIEKFSEYCDDVASEYKNVAVMKEWLEEELKMKFD